ncbi:MAG: hypothetical protein LBL76_04895, partial [Treponema sp.]|nr:hypothetical protein [Treponema sp.]
MECRLRLQLHYKENRENRERKPAVKSSIDSSGDIPLYPVSAVPHRDVADTVSLVAEGLYTCTALFTEADHPIRGMELFLNEESIGYGAPLQQLSPREHTADILFRKDFLNEGMLGDAEDRKEGRPFLLHYDLVQFALKVQDDERSCFYTSDYVLCLSKHGANADNIADIITYLAEFNDATVSRLMFSPTPCVSADSESLLPESVEAPQSKGSYKSLSDYIQLLSSIHTCYQEH